MDYRVEKMPAFKVLGKVEKECRFVKHIGQRTQEEKANRAVSWGSCLSGGCGRRAVLQGDVYKRQLFDCGIQPSGKGTESLKRGCACNLQTADCPK